MNWFELEGACNARDLGGLPARGGRTRPGVLARSDAVHELTEADVAALVDGYGLRHVIDLRAPGERREQGRGALGRRSVAYSELDVISDELIAERRRARLAALEAGPVEVEALIAEGYWQLLEHGAGAFCAALRAAAEPAGAPALVHCSAGKDRTGVLVALLLDAAGVERPAVVADYAATDSRIGLVRDRLAQMPAYKDLAAEAPEMLMRAHAGTMERFLARLDAECGGAAAWFDAQGGADALAAWTARFIEPA
ncbi:MAG: tyrosine-protein phosphatase [Acidimicrobiales bacterium]